MIKPLVMSQIDDVMEIWLSSNSTAHPFIPEEVWKSYYPIVRELLPASTVFVFQDDEVIKGFIGISDNSHIAGLFISQIYQSLGIGQQLLDYCKQMFATLTLDVFCKNVRAIQFYRRNGFEIVSQNMSDIFSEMEYHMEWCKPEIKKKNM